MVAMNAQTYARDMAEVEPGGWLIYDSTWPRSRLLNRDDITIIGIPLSRMCNEHFEGARARILMKNIAYVGVIAALLDVDLDIINDLLEETFAAKQHLIDSNMEAIRLGYDYARDNFPCPLPMRVEKMDETEGPHRHRRQHGGGSGLHVCRRDCRGLVSDYAVDVADGCIPDVLRALSGRPGNRQTNLLHHPGRRRAGRDWHGPGRKLERRAIVYADQRAGHLPDERVHRLCLLRRNSGRIFNVQRTGPSTGMPTRTQQCDLMSCAYASHGDTKHVLLFPADPAECFYMSPSGVRSRRATADARHGVDRSRYRHERLDGPGTRMG